MHGTPSTISTAYNLSPRQSALLTALIATGGLRDAAASLGVPYTSARNTLAELKAKLGAATVPMLIGLAMELSPDRSGGGTLARHDLLSLTDRQYAIVRSIGVAKSRQEIAERLGVSPPVLDAELKDIHLILGVSSAGELISTIRKAGLAGPAPDNVMPAEPDFRHALPMGTVMSGQRTIGYSDFGPTGAPPVLILHSTITSRAPPSRLVAALHKAGFRPLAIDRPGFGETSAGQPDDDGDALAASDVAAVCGELGLGSVMVIARGSGQAAVRLAQLQPSLVERAILVNPTPAIGFTSIDRGPLGAVKRAFAKRPWAVSAMIRVLANYATPSRMHDGMLRSFRDSPPDVALVENDPQFSANYFRAVRGFAEGRIAGYVAEQSAWAGGMEVEPMAGMDHWRIIQGRHFILHDPEQAMHYWRTRLPDTPISWVEEAGQLLAYSHPEHVVAALLDR